MLPFCGYHMADYWRHWLDMGARGGTKMPRVFHVNWFRKDTDGRWMWPGFSANMRVLQWIFGRIHGEHGAAETPVGLMPGPDALDFASLDLSSEALAQLLTIDREQWTIEVSRRDRFFESIGPRVPAEILREQAALRRSIERASSAGAHPLH